MVAIFAYGIGRGLAPLFGFLFPVIIVIGIGMFIFSLSPTIFYILLAVIIVAIIFIIYAIIEGVNMLDELEKDLSKISVLDILSSLFKSK